MSMSKRANYVDDLPTLPEEKGRRKLIRELLTKKTLKGKAADYTDLKTMHAIVVDGDGNFVAFFIPGARLWKFDFLDKYDELYILCWTDECMDMEEKDSSCQQNRWHD